MKTTFEDYKHAILSRYEIAKNEEKSHYLLDPTPASLKKLAAAMCDDLSYQDDAVFKNFFGFKSDVENKSKSILNYDTDKFRPLSKFLNGKSNLQEIQHANLLAVLLDFKDRPFVKFKHDHHFKEEEQQDFDQIERDDSKTAADLIEVASENSKLLLPVSQTSKRNMFKRSFLAVAIVIFLSVSAFALKTAFEEKCMIWVNDHYEKVDCETVSNQLANFATILPINDQLLKNFKRIEISDTTVFFKNGQPVVWYLKQNNKYDFFNCPGFHPTSKKTLKEVTPHIIKVCQSHRQK